MHVAVQNEVCIDSPNTLKVNPSDAAYLSKSAILCRDFMIDEGLSFMSAAMDKYSFQAFEQDFPVSCALVAQRI